LNVISLFSLLYFRFKISFGDIGKQCCTVDGKQKQSPLLGIFVEDSTMPNFSGRIRTFENNGLDMRHEDTFEGADDLNQLKILRTMAEPFYIIACYLTLLESSKFIQQDERRYKCACLSQSNQPEFHHCPATKKFKALDFCRQHIECNDPITACFDIAEKCSRLSNRVPEFMEECNEIAKNAIRLSVDILDQCSNTEEVNVLLSEQSGLTKVFNGSVFYNDDRYERLKYPRIYAALFLHHKEFVSHMYCQQTLRKKWYGGVKWKGQSIFYRVSNKNISLQQFPWPFNINCFAA
jgi:hypothetical protein